MQFGGSGAESPLALVANLLGFSQPSRPPPPRGHISTGVTARPDPGHRPVFIPQTYVYPPAAPYRNRGSSEGSSGDGDPGSRGSGAAGAGTPPPPMHRHMWPEFCRGAAASVTNIVLTFPLNKLISRQAYEGLSVREAFHTMRVEGVVNVYRGVFPPLLQRGVSMGIMYGTFDYYYHALEYLWTGRVEARAAIDVPTAERSSGIAVAAALLSGSTEGVLAPFERMQTILQHRHYTTQFANTADVVRKLWPLGVAEYYRGLSAILLRNGPGNAIFFMLRDPVRNLMPPYPPPLPGTIATDERDAAAAAGAEGGGGGGGAGTRPSRHASRMLTAGLSLAPGLLTSDNAARLWDVGRDFVAGAVLGACISTVFWPLNLAKSVMQLQIGGRFRGIGETLVQVYHERSGVRGIYRGVGGNVLRSLLSWGIINSSYGLYKRLFVWQGEGGAAQLR